MAIFFLGKYIAPAIFQLIQDQFFGPKKRKNSDIDFNRLVENKKSVLRKGENEKTSLGKKENQKKDQKGAQALYQTQFQSLSSKKNKNENELEEMDALKKVLSLFEGLQWGGSEDLKKLSSRFAKKRKIRIEVSELNNILKILLKRETLLARKTQKLPYLEEVLKALETAAFWKILLKELWEDEQAYIKFLSQKKKAKSKTIEQAILATLYPIMNSETDVPIEKIIKGKVSPMTPDKWEVSLKKFCLEESGKFFKSTQEYEEEILEYVELLKSVSPLPPLKNDKDLAGAFRILEVSEDTEFDIIKKKYKKLAILKHPDKLSSRGIPKEFEPLATENFALIQRAYDIIKKSKS